MTVVSEPGPASRHCSCSTFIFPCSLHVDMHFLSCAYLKSLHRCKFVFFFLLNIMRSTVFHVAAVFIITSHPILFSLDITREKPVFLVYFHLSKDEICNGHIVWCQKRGANADNQGFREQESGSPFGVSHLDLSATGWSCSLSGPERWGSQ